LFQRSCLLNVPEAIRLSAVWKPVSGYVYVGLDSRFGLAHPACASERLRFHMHMYIFSPSEGARRAPLMQDSLMGLRAAAERSAAVGCRCMKPAFGGVGRKESAIRAGLFFPSSCKSAVFVARAQADLILRSGDSFGGGRGEYGEWRRLAGVLH